MPLNEQRRSQLDGIVNQMTTAGEPEENIRFVVEDFKKKYEAEAPEAPQPAQSGLDLTLGVKDAMIGFGKGAAELALLPGKAMHMIPGVSKGVDALYGTPGLSKQSFANTDKALESSNTAQMVGKGAEKAVEFLIPAAKAGTVAKAMIPTVAKAGAKFDDVAKVASHLPIKADDAGQVALRMQELATQGGKMPKVANDLLKRLTDPTKGELTFAEARGFYSNITRLSAKEQQRLTPVVRREVAKLKEAMDLALRETAGNAGKGAEYASAMKEYSRAARLGKAGHEIKKYGTGALVGASGATGVAGAYALGKKLGLID